MAEFDEAAERSSQRPYRRAPPPASPGKTQWVCYNAALNAPKPEGEIPMRTPHLLSALLLLSCASMPIFAQQPGGRADAPPPPRLERLEEGEPPTVTIPGGGQPERSITEKREQGRVTEIEVHTGHSTYVVKPLNPAGSALPGDTQANTNRAAQFKVKEFDFSKPEDLKEQPQPQNLQSPPTPAVPPTAK
jgi:hypothetical protein